MLPRETTIIGGGIVGLLTAVRLKRAARTADSDTAVTVLEQGTLGAGSTLRAGCGLRTVYRYPTNVRLAKASLEFWKQSDQLLADGITVRPNGYLFLTGEDTRDRQLRREAQRQRHYGLESAYASPPSEAHSQLALSYDNYESTLFAGNAAVANPLQMVNSIVKTARDYGVTIHAGTTVTDITDTHDGVTLQTDTMGELSTDTAVNATGAWASQLAKTTGVELPISPQCRRLAVLDKTVSPDEPLTVDIDTGVYFLPDENGVVHAGGHFGGNQSINPNDPAAFADTLSTHWKERFRRLGDRVWTGLADATVDQGWTGLYATTPSRRPIIDRIGNVVHVTGFSGHGIMQAPGAARVTTALLANETPTVCDPASLAHDRPVRPPDIQF